MTHHSSFITFGLAVLYLLLPGHPLGWLAGLPLGLPGLAVMVAIGLMIFATWPVAAHSLGWRPALLFGLLCGLKVGLALATPTYGLEASYWVKPGSSAPPERSTDFPGLEATRLDRELLFEGDRFPLHFFNDNVRFNYYRSEEPDRAALPFSVRWRGLLDLPSAADVQLWLTAIGVARLELGDGPPLLIDDSARTTVARILALPAGQVPIQLQYIRRAGAPAMLALESDLGGERAPLAAPDLLANPTTVPIGLAKPLLWLSHLLDLVFIAGVAIFGWAHGLRPRLTNGSAVERPREVDQRWPAPAPRRSIERPLLAMVLALVFAYAAISSLDLRGRVVLLDGGADWLTYETYARDIQLNGPLMTLGKALGKGRSYFFQPFYPYALATMHWLTGEGLYGVVVLQVFGVGLAGVLVYWLGERMFGALSGAVALAIVIGLLGPFQLDWVARHLLSENIYFWLLPATALGFLALAERPTLMGGVGAGLLLGLCCVTRGPTLLWVPAVLWVTWRRAMRTVLVASVGADLGVRPGPDADAEDGHTGPPLPNDGARQPNAGRPRSAVLLSGLTCLAIVLLVPVRNYVVSGHPALVATNNIATMELAHPLTPKVSLDGAEANPLYRSLKLDFSAIQFIEFMRQDPLGYAATLPPLGLYALGLPFLLEPGSPIRWELVALVGLYLAYLPIGRRQAAGGSGSRPSIAPARAPTGPSAAACRRPPAGFVLHSFIWLHFGVMLIFLPNVYGYRQVLPMYLFLAVFAGRVLAGGLAPLIGWLKGRTEQQPERRDQSTHVEQHVQGAGAAARHEELA